MLIHNNTLMFFTKLAVLLATSLAACTKCFLATGLLVFPEANLQALHNTLVCLAITVAADSTCGSHDYINTPTNQLHPPAVEKNWGLVDSDMPY